MRRGSETMLNTTIIMVLNRFVCSIQEKRLTPGITRALMPC